MLWDDLQRKWKVAERLDECLNEWLGERVTMRNKVSKIERDRERHRMQE